MKRRTMAFGGLLMAVAITGYSVAGTYAKYISQVGITDEARVAKWDFRNNSTTTVDLFQASYKNANGIYVASKDGAKVVAPGTEGKYEYTITGSAETNFKVTQNKTITNKVFLLDYDGNISYNPIEFSFDNGATWAKAETPVMEEGKIVALTFEKVEDNGTVYPANYELKNTDVTGTIMWRWVFDEESKPNDSIHTSSDQLDTVLGTKAVKENLTIEATIGATVVQTQEIPNNVENAYFVTASNNLPQADAEYFAEKAGYDASKAAGVKFNGNTLTGTIEETTGENAKLAKAYFGEYEGTPNGTGYYYTVNIRNTANETFYILFSKEGKVMEIAANDSLSLMQALNPSGNQKIVYTVYNNRADAEADKGKDVADRKGRTYSIDYSELQFN